MPRITLSVLHLSLLFALSAPSFASPPSRSDWRGVFFNPQVAADPNFPWIIYYDAHRAKVRTALSELRTNAGVNLVDVHIMIPHSLRVPAQGNRVGERVEQWANTAFLDNVRGSSTTATQPGSPRNSISSTTDGFPTQLIPRGTSAGPVTRGGP